MEPEGFAGFGSPVASPGLMTLATPENVREGVRRPHEQGTDSPLMFKRTPAAEQKGANSSTRFGDWVVSTSPYAVQKTPPTVSMKSMAAGIENTPPRHNATPMSEGAHSNERFQAWLKATNSTSWTPKQNPQAFTPPRVPAPTPAGTPMSITFGRASAASPATEEPRSRPLFDLGDQDSSESEDDEADTVINDAAVAAAAARMRAALLAAGTGAGNTAAPPSNSSAVPASGIRAPTSSPVVNSLAPAAGSRQIKQPAVADSLCTPMSQLSVSRTSASNIQQPQHGTPATASRFAALCSLHAPSSPMDKVIDLMMQCDSQRKHHRPHQTPGKSAVGGAVPSRQPAASPEQQVIQLMMQQVQPGSNGHVAEEVAVAAEAHQAPEQSNAAGAPFGSPAEEAPGPDDDDAADYSSSATESDDEIDVAELQHLVGSAAAGPGTPFSDIINMMLTPELKGTPSFTPAGARAAAQHAEDDMGPRVLFADE